MEGFLVNTNLKIVRTQLGFLIVSSIFMILLYACPLTILDGLSSSDFLKSDYVLSTKFLVTGSPY
jgi:hypothetical protein